MTANTEAAVEAADQAACQLDRMFHDIFTKEDRLDILRAALSASAPHLVAAVPDAAVEAAALAEIGGAIREVRQAFGAPGDFGMATKQGKALFRLYEASKAAIRARSAAPLPPKGSGI